MSLPKGRSRAARSAGCASSATRFAGGVTASSPTSTRPSRARGASRRTFAPPGGLLARGPAVPTAVWGRDDLGAGETWNSNSLISWLLVGSGIEAERIPLPAHGRAPGWTAGIVVADREQRVRYQRGVDRGPPRSVREAVALRRSDPLLGPGPLHRLRCDQVSHPHHRPGEAPGGHRSRDERGGALASE